MNPLIERVRSCPAPRVALLGDFMLDRFVYGDVERISPEAPVPVLRSLRNEARPGAAGNVAACILAFGGHVTCVGVIGHDPAGEDLKTGLVSAGAETSSLLRLSGRPTTVKSRYVGLAQHRHAQQMFRVDDEAGAPLEENVFVTIQAAVRSEIHSCSVLVIEDYDKGVCTDRHTPEIIAEARNAGCTVIVDPARIREYRRYRGASLLTPNRYEAELASGVAIVDDASLERAARQVLLRAEAEAVLITLDREGAYLAPRESESRRVPHARPRSVYDITGAGDEVTAVLGVMLSADCPLAEAAAVANVAGGLEVQRFGVAPVSREEVLEELADIAGARTPRPRDADELAAELQRRRVDGARVVFTNGCFDLLHVGHIEHLRQASELGDVLVVAINSDASVRRLKGPPRPVMSAGQRAALLGALECVDYVTVFDAETPEALLEQIRPDVLVKGGNTEVVIGREIVEGYGGEVLTLEPINGVSTQEIINRIAEQH